MTEDSAADIDDHLRREARDWVMRLNSGTATTADAAALNQWRAKSKAHRKSFAEANRLWDMAAFSAKEALAEGASAAGAVPHSRGRGGLERRMFLGGALAASAAGVAYLAVKPPLHLWPTISEFAADVRTSTGQQRNIVTAGGASVELNTNTSVNLPASSSGADSVELMAGEAAVTATSRPVVVLAAGGRARASGAQFNVRYEGPEVQVTCLDGTVQVSCGANTVTLSKRQQVSYSHVRLGDLAEIDPAVVGAWREGLLVFRNDPLQRVVDEVNRYRSGRIVVMNAELSRKLVFASFRLDRLYEVVPRIANVFAARVRSFPGGIVVLS